MAAQNNFKDLHNDAKKYNTKGTNILYFINPNQLPNNKKPT